ncbi:MAG TPA: class I SAM-dependent methyltransferase [Sulfurovum sp.]|nr:class I SAM-dependent methyltransferase [Sulfurovum sp.]
MQPHHKASAWFDELYKEHKESHENIPWARLSVNPLLQVYLDENRPHTGKALVIGCGLGDDAVALEAAGYEVTAIDVSQAALDIAKERFPDSKVRFEKQDIFDMPEKYKGYFDFVFEALTIQSLPVEFREKMIEAVADTVGEEGRLLLIAHKREAQFDGPPWPLEPHEVDLFKSHGMRELSHELHTEASKISSTRFRVLYTKDKKL